MRGRELAADLWRRHRLCLPVDLRRLAAELGIEAESWPFKGRVREFIVGQSIGVRPGVSRPWFRWYVAHAIGHHLLHEGTCFYLYQWQWASRCKDERQAEDFAAWLVAGADGWRLTAAELGIPRDKLSEVRRLTSPPSRQGLVEHLKVHRFVQE